MPAEQRPAVSAPGGGVVWKWGVPVDDREHELPWPADATVVHVAPTPDDPAVVQVWTFSSRTHVERPRRLRVFGDGQPIPAPCAHLGTAVTDVGLVWHLIEVL